MVTLLVKMTRVAIVRRGRSRMGKAFLASQPPLAAAKRALVTE